MYGGDKRAFKAHPWSPVSTSTLKRKQPSLILCGALSEGQVGGRGWTLPHHIQP